jgi:SynChlorMet cassette protein ScmC
MELKKSRLNGSPKLIFFMRGASNGPVDIALPCVAAKLRSWSRNAGWVVSDPASLRVWCSESIPDVLCEVSHHDQVPEIQFLNMWYALLPIYQRSIYGGGLPLHAGLVELDGLGVLLAASGDKGKSTCCLRLPDYWKPLCDDETLVVLDKKKKYRAHPFPTWSEYYWKRSEKTWDVQYSLPLSGVFFLEQSDADEVVPVGEGQAAVLMSESASQVCEKFWRALDREDQRPFRNGLFNNACEIAKQIPAYRLSVSRHGRFWEKMEQVLGL